MLCIYIYVNYIWYTVGAEAEDDRIELLLSQVKGKDITELIASGREKLASVPSGGAGAVAVAAPATGGAAPPAAAEAKKEEKAEDEGESDDVSTEYNLNTTVISCYRNLFYYTIVVILKYQFHHLIEILTSNNNRTHALICNSLIVKHIDVRIFLHF